MERRFPFVAVEATAERADELGALLCELGASGVEVRDEQTLSAGPGPGRVLLVASFASHAAADGAKEELARLEPELQASTGEIVGEAWRDRYKDYFKPFALTPSLTVAPPWVSYQPAPGELVLWLDPGRAFGTGLHATTALVAEELEGRRACYAGRRVLDVGTGSGILALAALAFGAASARAIDSDPEVIEVAADNALRNGMHARLELDTAPLESIAESFSMVVANIEARTLKALAPVLARCVAPGGMLVLSGILASEEEEVAAAYAALALVHVARRGDGEDAWVALALERR